MSSSASSRERARPRAHVRRIAADLVSKDSDTPEYGRLSLFRDPAGLDGERARELAFRNLETRGKSPDEVAARAEYLDLLGIRPGQQVLDVGCGSGVVTRDMARRVSPGGRAIGLDPSAEFLTIARELARDSHPDRALIRRVVAAFSDHAAVDGWLVRRLPGLLSQAGLQHVATRAFLPLEREPDGFYGRAAVRAADVAAQTGAITESEREGWLAALRAEQAAGNFLGGRVHIFCWGVKP
ncbi:MAG: hypothetical protein DME00_05215 [Candidatus Rokuibacteriota bacterium]|nr:MAG: hypothetical protein DME00_05215 [Candidatus Rokubacteria bacterium]